MLESAFSWILRRIDGEEIGERTPVGFVPKEGSVRQEGIGAVDWKTLLSVPKQFWREEVAEVETYLEEQLGEDLPPALRAQMTALRQRLESYAGEH